jgi:4-hydroxy-tetrahydrodipicolinate synthase
MKPVNITGMGVALITPFKTNGDVDFNILSKLIDMHLAAGTDYLVVLGTTAETPTLSAEEQREIRQSVVKQVNRKIPVVLGFGSNNTRALLRNLETEDLTGIDALLTVTPYYNRPTQEGLYRHYLAMAAATPLPIILYNVPARTGVNLSADTTLRIANECRNIIAIKEASGIITQISAIARRRPAGFHVISGDDNLTLPLMSLGVDGVISVIGNAFPRRIRQMVHHALDGNFTAALEIHNTFSDLLEYMSADGNPAGIKCLMSQMNLCQNNLRLPLVPATTVTSQKTAAFLEKHRYN